MTTTDFITDLTARMAADGFTLPETWQGRMEALIAGAIDSVDAQDLAQCCGEIADSRAVNNRGPTFAFIAEQISAPETEHDGLGVAPEAIDVLRAIARFADGDDWQE